MQKEKILVMYNLYYISEKKENYFNNNKINNDIIKYIINKNNNYDNVGIRIKMKNSCSIDKGSNYSKSIKLLNNNINKKLYSLYDKNTIDVKIKI